MVNTRYVRFRVIKELDEKIKYDALSEGKTIADYMRDLAWKAHSVEQEQLNRVHDLLVKQKRNETANDKVDEMIRMLDEMKKTAKESFLRIEKELMEK